MNIVQQIIEAHGKGSSIADIVNEFNMPGLPLTVGLVRAIIEFETVKFAETPANLNHAKAYRSDHETDDDLETTNIEKAEIGARILKYYSRITSQYDNHLSADDALINLLTSIRHTARTNGLNINEALKTSEAKHDAEFATASFNHCY